MKKDITQRIEEIKEIYNKLIELGIHKRFETLNPFYEICEKYVKECLSSSGKIKIPEIERILVYKLTVTVGKYNEVVLRQYS